MRHVRKPDGLPCECCRARPPRAPGLVLCAECRARADSHAGAGAGWMLVRGSTGTGWDTPRR